jgi:DNA-binding MarR family transcriptional regulator
MGLALESMAYSWARGSNASGAQGQPRQCRMEDIEPRCVDFGDTLATLAVRMNRPLPDIENEYPLNDDLSFLRELWALNHALERASKRMETRLGVTARQRVIIRIVGKYPDISAGYLATLLRIDPGTLSAAVARLEERGVLERRRDSEDERRVTLRLTRQGRALDVPSRYSIESAVAGVLSGTGQRERKSLSEFLGKLVRALDKLEKLDKLEG